MARGDGQDGVHARIPAGGERRSGAQEALHRGPRGVHDEGGRVGVRFVADGVRGAAGQRDNRPGCRSPTARATVRILCVEGELALQDQVDLARVVPVSSRYWKTVPCAGRIAMCPRAASSASTRSLTAMNASRSAIPMFTGRSRPPVTGIRLDIGQVACLP